MDDLGDILSSRNFSEPPEILNIKKYIMDELGVAVAVQIRASDIVISVPSSALANTLRLRGPELKRRCGVDKHLTFRLV